MVLTDTRSGLLDVAAARFLEDGYAATSVRSIADAMGIKAGSIYYHFESKDDILAEVLDVGIARITDAVDVALEGVDDPRARIEVAVAAHLRALVEFGAYTACHVRVFHQAPPAVRRRSIVARDAYEHRWTELLEGAADDGVLRSVDVPLARLFLLGALNATVDWLGDGDHDVSTLGRRFADLFLNGAARKDET